MPQTSRCTIRASTHEIASLYINWMSRMSRIFIDPLRFYVYVLFDLARTSYMKNAAARLPIPTSKPFLEALAVLPAPFVRILHNMHRS